MSVRSKLAWFQYFEPNRKGGRLAQASASDRMRCLQTLERTVDRADSGPVGDDVRRVRLGALRDDKDGGVCQRVDERGVCDVLLAWQVRIHAQALAALLPFPDHHLRPTTVHAYHAGQWRRPLHDPSLCCQGVRI